MGIIGGKRISVQRSRRSDCLDVVFCEEIQHKKFLCFVSRKTATQLMIIAEDLLMKPSLKLSTWSFKESGRKIEVNIVPNRRGNSLVIKSITSDRNQWRRRVYIPEGQYGEGWLSFSRQIKEILHNSTTTSRGAQSSSPSILQRNPSTTVRSPPSPPPPPPPTVWPRLLVSLPSSNRFEGWEYTVICTVKSPLVDWNSVGLKLAKVFQSEGDFDLYPFSPTQALIMTTTLAASEGLCRASTFLNPADRISLEPWHPSINKEDLPVPSTDCWIGVLGLPFHLWHTAVFEGLASLFGGLLSIDDNTRSFNDLSMAKLQVKGHSCQIPQGVDIEEGDATFKVKIQVIPPPQQRVQGMIRISPPFMDLAPATDLARLSIASPTQPLPDSNGLPNGPDVPLTEGGDLNSNSNFISNLKWSFPIEVGQVKRNLISFKKQAVNNRHRAPRKTGIWQQRREPEVAHVDYGENSVSTHGTEYSTTKDEVNIDEARSATCSVDHNSLSLRESVHSMTSYQRNSLPHESQEFGPSQQLTETVPDVTPLIETRIITPQPASKENSIHASDYNTHLADLISLFGIQAKDGRNFKLLENIISQSKPVDVHRPF